MSLWCETPLPKVCKAFQSKKQRATDNIIIAKNKYLHLSYIYAVSLPILEEYLYAASK